MADQLSQTTSIFDLNLWVILGVCVGAAFVLLLFLVSLCLVSSKRNKSKSRNSDVSKDIEEVKVDFSKPQGDQVHVDPDSEPEPALLLPLEEESHIGFHGIRVDLGREHRILYRGSVLNASGGGGEVRISGLFPEVSHLGWGHWYTLRELEASTNGFSDENVIGEGGYGIVYRGVLRDNTQVAVKNLLNNRGQAEQEFKVEVEAIGRVRHKNLVRLLGYCAEGAHRMLVYEYVNNGNLEQWLHEDVVGPCSPLSWEIRMNIIIGTAKGLTYLHEGLDPKVIHRDIKSSNILLDKKWNPKVSDFGLAKLLEPESSYITTRVMGTFGYVSPEYARTGMLNERSDVYSFGILIMETISGRKPIDYSRPAEEVNLVDWLKKLVSNGGAEGVLDPKLPEKPTLKALKQTLLVALRCVDRNAERRPKMGHIVHMLESEDLSFRDCDRRSGRLPGTSGSVIHQDIAKDESVIHKRVAELGVNESAVCVA